MSAQSQAVNELFFKDTLINGQPARIECINLAGQTFTVTRGLLTVVRLDDDWFHEVSDPERVIDAMTSVRGLRADLFTFSQRLPNFEPRYHFHQEWESIAAIPLESYEHWWSTQIESATRNKIRKSRKLGVEVRECAYDDEFVRGMTAIFNEAPIRQGRSFWHYGKDFETVKAQFSRYLFREDLLGAYYNGELIGFAMVGKNRIYGDLGQIISKLQHRDKAPTNALVAKAVELCCARKLPYLVYAFWIDGSLGDFKRQSGFQEVKLPRYFVPLTAKGRLALRGGAHRGLQSFVRPAVLDSLKRARHSWYAWRGQYRRTGK